MTSTSRTSGSRTTNSRTNRTPTNGKTDKFANMGATLGGFVGAVGGSFIPPLNITINEKSAASKGGGQVHHFVLGEPTFASTDDVRSYCNHARALMTQAAIELAIASKILEARLGQAKSLPDDNPVQARLRARKVGRKLKKAGDGATASAKNCVAAYAAFEREYADLLTPRSQRSQPTYTFKF